MLNFKRPQDPFTLANEVDWKASGPIARQSLTLQYDNLGNWKSPRPSPTSDWIQSSPLDTNSDLLREEAAISGVKSRCPSQSSVVSMSLNTVRKAAPPIPKKPALLSNRQHGQESGIGDHGMFPSSRPPLGAQTAFNDGAQTSFSPIPQWNSQRETYGQRAIGSDGRPLPPRGIGAVASVSNGLMDDDSEVASAIRPLQPMRRQQ